MERDLKEFHQLYAKTNSGCWIWLGQLSESGYGQFKGMPASRFALIAVTKDPGDSRLYACHTCDTPACVNPTHLFWGTSRDNMKDAKKKGRIRHQGKQLSREEVIAIFNSPETYRKLGLIYGVSRQTVCNIKNGVTHSDITLFSKSAGG